MRVTRASAASSCAARCRHLALGAGAHVAIDRRERDEPQEASPRRTVAPGESALSEARTMPATGAVTLIVRPGGTTTSPPTRRTAGSFASSTCAVWIASRFMAAALRRTTGSSLSGIG